MFIRNLRCGIRILAKNFSSKCAKSVDKDNLSVVIHGKNDLRLESRPIPKPKDYQVLLQMETVGICGSDVHFLVDGQLGPYKIEKPMVTGHEASGTVIEVGKKVKTLKPGDHVAVEPGFGCRMCNYCKDGRYHLCPDMIFCANPPYDGNLSRYYVHEADFCFKLPDHLSLDEGALMEPLAVGVHSCKKGKIKIGDVVVVMGAGPIGLVSMLAAKAMGASTVLITDIVDFRLEKAKCLGADCVYRINKDAKEKDVVNDIRKMLGEDPDVSIECTGLVQPCRVSLEVTKTGGIVVLTGMAENEMQLPIVNTIFREVDLRGVFRYNNDYPTAIAMVESGRVNVKPLITHHFKIEDAKKAFETAKTREGNPIKIMIHPNPEWNECGQ